jgi:hypothetical protein
MVGCDVHVLVGGDEMHGDGVSTFGEWYCY